MAKEVICTWAIRVKVCCKVVPQEVCYLPFDKSIGLREVSIGGRAFQK